MIENRRGLTIFSHTMLILGIIVILFPLYVAFVAATLDTKAVFDTPMTLIPGGHLFENMKTIWTQGVGANSAPFWLMMLNSFIMAFGITVGKITVSMLSAFAIVWFRFPLRNLFFWMIFITLMLPQWLQTQMGYTAIWAGLAAAPMGFLPLLLTPFIGRYAIP
jgi:sn-glycerol 3-phosphate transport system permease protein